MPQSSPPPREHDRFPYSPIVDRAPLRWPNGARVAVWVIPNIEHYEYIPPAASFRVFPRTPAPDVREYSYRDFGNRVGMWRMLDVIDEHAIPCTVSLNVGVLEHYPEIVVEMEARGFDYLSHGTYNTRVIVDMDEPEEREFLEVCDRVLERHTGQRFRGMLAPYIMGNWITPDLMAEHGMLYHADWVHDERPAPLVVRGGQRFVAMPYSFLLNDGKLYRKHYEVEAYFARTLRSFERLDREGASGGRVMAMAIHPFLVGQAHVVRHLSRLFAHLRDRGAWIATASDIVDHYLATAYDSDLALIERSRSGSA
jgi:peptidoglycan/xylan/chitin deacetylase (PgdA/CDA1 family)